MKSFLLAVAVFCVPFMAMAENLLKNSDFSQTDANGRPASWIISKGMSKIEKGGKDFPSVLVLESMAEQKNFKAGFYQKLPAVARGEYILSGYFSGDVNALWLVVQAGTKPFRLWLGKNKFEKSEKDGWNKFSVKVSVDAAEEAGKGLLVIEPFTGAAGQNTYFADIKLESQND